MATDPEVLDCELVPLPSPLRIAAPAFLSSLKEVETRIATLKVIDAPSAQEAATLQARLTTAGKMLEQTRQKLKEPVLEQARKIDALARGPGDRIERAKDAIKKQLVAYNDEQERLAEEAEAARQKELARLEALRVAEEKTARLKAEQIARENQEAIARAAEATKAGAPPPLDVDFGDDEPVAPPPKTEVEKQIEAVKHAPAVVQPKPTGVAFKTTLVATVADINKVPDIFVIRTPNMQAIRTTFCNGWKTGEPMPECAGVRFEILKTPVSTGR